MTDLRRIPPEKRFWLQVNKNGPESRLGRCWIFGRRKSGYGVIAVHGQSVRAARYSWILHFGQVSNDRHILHHCDNTLCVNPEHLFLGDQNSNMKDMASKGRGRGKPPLGEGNGSAKLTVEQVIEIKELFETGDYTKYALSRKYGVSSTTIRRVIMKRNWSHIE